MRRELECARARALNFRMNFSMLRARGWRGESTLFRRFLQISVGIARSEAAEVYRKRRREREKGKARILVRDVETIELECVRVSRNASLRAGLPFVRFKGL